MKRPTEIPSLRRDISRMAAELQSFLQHPRLKRFLWQGKIAPAFWTISSVFSLALNVALILVLIVLGRHLFALKELVSEQLIGGLHHNFVRMDEAHIMTTITVEDTIQVEDTIPVVFDLQLAQNTRVALVEDTPIRNATIFLNNQPVPLDLILRQGTELHISLNLTVPVSQTVPVKLNVPVQLQVPVDIPLNQTQLHEPFVGLQGVVLLTAACSLTYPHRGKRPPCAAPGRAGCATLFSSMSRGLWIYLSPGYSFQTVYSSS